MYLQRHQAARLLSGIQNRQGADEGVGCPAPCSHIREDSTRLGSAQPPRPQGELGGSSGFTPTLIPQPGCPLLLRIFGLSSPSSLVYPQSFRRQSLAQQFVDAGPAAFLGLSACRCSPPTVWSFQTGLGGALGNSPRRNQASELFFPV